MSERVMLRSVIGGVTFRHLHGRGYQLSSGTTSFLHGATDQYGPKLLLSGFSYLVGFLRRGIGPSLDLCLRKTRRDGAGWGGWGWETHNSLLSDM
jgi:hypothetical protein